MFQKIALLAASLTAALVIAGGLALAGFGPSGQPATDAVQLVQPAAATADVPATDPPVQVDTVYLTPEATPGHITVTKVRVASTASHDGESEGEEDDD